MKCPYCGRDTEVINGAKLYPHHRHLASKKFVRCEPCKAHVGCHKNGKPFGTIAKFDLRILRQQTHKHFDILWQNGSMSRTAAYTWLARELGIKPRSCHIGMFDEDTCRKVISLSESRS